MPHTSGFQYRSLTDKKYYGDDKSILNPSYFPPFIKMFGTIFQCNHEMLSLFVLNSLDDSARRLRESSDINWLNR